MATKVHPRIEATGWQVVSGSAESFAAFMLAERNCWQSVIRRSGAGVD